ncbi:MAG: hypothetical protein H7145_17240 [Akkermansiaceae bacterium]|nr:hypothetical protein [Armatimonadota bacterium]
MAYRQLPPNIPRTPQQAQQAQQLGRKGAIGCGIVWLFIVSFVALPGIVIGGVGFSALFVVPFLAVGIGMIAWGMAPTIRAWKITPPDIQVSRDAVRLGESFDFRYNQVLKDRLDVDSAKAVFLMRETATYRRGTDTYTETHEIPVETKEIRGGTYTSGEQLDLSHRFTVPLDGMHTFIASNNRIEWLIKVKVSIARWPDVDEAYPILVLPEQHHGYGAENR